MGASFVTRLAEETGARRKDIIYAFLAAEGVLETGEKSQEIRVLDRANMTRNHLNVLSSIQVALDKSSRWMLERRYIRSSLEESVDKFESRFYELVGQEFSFVPEVDRARLLEDVQQLLSYGLEKELANSIAAFSISTAYLDIIEISDHSKSDVVQVASLYMQISAALQIRQLLEEVTDFETRDKWEALALRAISADIRRTVAELTRKIIEDAKSVDSSDIEGYFDERSEILDRFRLSVHEFQKKHLGIPALFVIIKQLQRLAR
jgi:glutamate dehydrogenase